MFATSGMLFNHEPPRRREILVARKITRAVARILARLEHHLYLGNLDEIRDWGFAPEYVEGMWRMLQADEPEDFVLATGGDFTVRDLVVTAFDHAGLNWEKYVRFDERFLRPTEVDADGGGGGGGGASKAQERLDWKAQVQTDELSRIMVDADIEALQHEGRPWYDMVMARLAAGRRPRGHRCLSRRLASRSTGLQRRTSRVTGASWGRRSGGAWSGAASHRWSDGRRASWICGTATRSLPSFRSARPRDVVLAAAKVVGMLAIST
ncbi:hypothetical protein JOE61_001474 [Nocardioides salarius]|uniref:GDP-mannose 4,6-dehydratase n=1 Tax=Nocardioides salarius TaxID=374513 RepID=A0ABS2M8Z8_9ACTN|nr:hypothetical protein [Nocardioides salarius]